MQNRQNNPIKSCSSELLPVPALPTRLLLDLRTDCNLKCPMCIVHGDTNNDRLKEFLRRSMSLENAREVLDQVMAGKPLVQPNLWSEPLLAHDLEEHLKAMKDRGLTVSMNTNGLPLTDKLAKFFIDIKLDSIAFSIDAVTRKTLKKVRGIDKLEKIHAAVDLMMRMRGQETLPRIGVTFTIQKINEHERDAFVEYWAPRVDFVRVGELFEDGRFPGIKPEEPRRPCNSLYTTMAVHTNGNVSICCLDGFGETYMGNVFVDGGVKAVWHGEKFTEIRRLHESNQYEKVPFCVNCDRWLSFDYEEEIKDGMLIRRSAEYTYYNKLEKLGNWGDSLQGTHTLNRKALLQSGVGSENNWEK